jgi:asparagine synthase (glutamine-hydrolysing)
MCGICGKLTFDGSEVSQELLKHMCATIRHRGPDDEGIYSSGHVGLGQRRLSIIDLRPIATAPMSNEDGHIWLVFNGEIYNFQKLRGDLQKCGHYFKTLSDTEVIVHAYEEYGYDCLAHFDGMFSFALWDSRRRELFCARDRIGQKPFCYTHLKNAFIFGSEIKAITADPQFTVEPDYGAIDVYLSYGYIPSQLCAFKNIAKLQPGHFLVCRDNGYLIVKRYWSPPRIPNKSKAPIEQLKEELDLQLREAVRKRMIADVPLGAFLSGGIDSTTIVALMAQESSLPVRTFSIGFKDDAFNELPYAKLLAERYGTEHHEFIIEPDAAEVLPVLVCHYNEPFADSSALPTYYLSKLTREHVTVALSGDGGDESFAGYRHYGLMKRWQRATQLLKPVRPLLHAINRGFDLLPYHNRLARAQRGIHMLSHDLAEQYRLQLSAGFKPQEKRQLYTPEFQQRLSKMQIKDPIAAFEDAPDLNPIDFCMVHDQSFYLPDELMVKSDIASMANSLELRSPMLDHNFVAFAATIPVKWKRRNSAGKWIFKETFGKLLPEEILNKPKSGFSIPLARWFKNELNGLLHDYLMDHRAKQRGLFQHRYVSRIVREHETGVRLWHNRLWALLVLEMWFRKFID